MTEPQTDPRAVSEPGPQPATQEQPASDEQPAGDETSSQQPARTLWAPLRKTPLRQFLQTETGSAAILTGAVLAALIWANVSAAAYQPVWGTELPVRMG